MATRPTRRSHSWLTVLSLTLGLVLGWTVMAAADGLRGRSGVQQGPDLITQSGSWSVEIECDSQRPITISIDGAPATPVSVIWAGTGPYTTRVPYPVTPAARTLGTHTFAISVPAVTETLVDGTPYVRPAGTLTRTVTVLPDTPPAAAPPRFLRWIKIALPIALAVVAIIVGFAG